MIMKHFLCQIYFLVSYLAKIDRGLVFIFRQQYKFLRAFSLNTHKKAPNQDLFDWRLIRHNFKLLKSNTKI